MVLTDTHESASMRAYRSISDRFPLDIPYPATDVSVLRATSDFGMFWYINDVIEGEIWYEICRDACGGYRGYETGTLEARHERIRGRFYYYLDGDDDDYVRRWY